MAETQLVITEERLNEILSFVFRDGKVAVDGKDDVVNGIDELRPEITTGLMQLFIKNPLFSSEGFRFKLLPPDAARSGYIVDQIAGDGHVKLLTFPWSFNEYRIFRLSVFYQSFFIAGTGIHIGPSIELKGFYGDLVKIASRKTKKIEIFKGGFMRIQDIFLDHDEDIIGFIKSKFRSVKSE